MVNHNDKTLQQDPFVEACTSGSLEEVQSTFREAMIGLGATAPAENADGHIKSEHEERKNNIVKGLNKIISRENNQPFLDYFIKKTYDHDRIEIIDFQAMQIINFVDAEGKIKPYSSVREYVTYQSGRKRVSTDEENTLSLNAVSELSNVSVASEQNTLSLNAVSELSNVSVASEKNTLSLNAVSESSNVSVASEKNKLSLNAVSELSNVSVASSSSSTHPKKVRVFGGGSSNASSRIVTPNASSTGPQLQEAMKNVLSDANSESESESVSSNSIAMLSGAESIENSNASPKPEEDKPIVTSETVTSNIVIPPDNSSSSSGFDVIAFEPQEVVAGIRKIMPEEKTDAANNNVEFHRQSFRSLDQEMRDCCQASLFDSQRFQGIFETYCIQLQLVYTAEVDESSTLEAVWEGLLRGYQNTKSEDVPDNLNEIEGSKGREALSALDKTDYKLDFENEQEKKISGYMQEAIKLLIARPFSLEKSRALYYLRSLDKQGMMVIEADGSYGQLSVAEYTKREVENNMWSVASYTKIGFAAGFLLLAAASLIVAYSELDFLEPLKELSDKIMDDMHAHGLSERLPLLFSGALVAGGGAGAVVGNQTAKLKAGA